MKTLPDKNYSIFNSLHQLNLPMDVGVLIPNDDSVRLLVFVLKQLDLSALYEAYAEYREKRRKAEAERERREAERGTGVLAAADDARSVNAAGNTDSNSHFRKQ
ncbi:MAG: hypothetical protein LBI94_09095 [Treponema sp.]|jgi:hypothetical protein|nr:hypothetical protein [Treponema sp.]